MLERDESNLLQHKNSGKGYFCVCELIKTTSFINAE